MRFKNSAVLGVFVTDTSVEGVLLRKDEEGKIHVVDRYSKHRARRGESVLQAAALLPGLKDRSESDYTMEVGDGSQQASDLFLSGEFGKSVGTDVAEKVRVDTSARRSTTPFGAQLREILAECGKAGYPAPTLAFCIGSSEVVYQEIGLQRSADASTKDKAESGFRLSKEDQKVLHSRLEEVLQKEQDRKQVGFVPMVPEFGRRRFMAVVPAVPSPVMAALDVVAKSAKSGSPTAQLIDSELSLLSAMVRSQSEKPEGVSAVVRVGANDTMVLFMKDGVLRKYEHLRSLTSYDSIDTVCSRVVLKQDELRIGSISELYVSTEHQGTSAIESFSSFFPDAKVHDLKSVLIENGLDATQTEDLRPGSIPAAGAALRILGSKNLAEKDGFAINLLDRKRRGKSQRAKVGFQWHAYVMMAILFGVALYYTWEYMTNQEVIDARQEELRINPPAFPTENAALLRFRVDSLQQVSQRYTRAMFVLDSLLTGSDKWSKTLDGITRSTGSIQSLWLKAWTPEGNGLRVEGNALQRNRIAALAQKWNGSIEKLNFAEIQGMRVYSFIMTVPVESKLPDVVHYLRENSLENLGPAESEALTSLSASSTPSPSNQ